MARVVCGGRGISGMNLNTDLTQKLYAPQQARWGEEEGKRMFISM